MTSKLNTKAIAEYAQAYSTHICNDFFAKNDTISGSELLNLSAVDQVNLLSVKALYENWKLTTEQFKSPFFDFENDRVKAALQDFMNVTSQHISVKKSDLLPIITKATQDTITLALEPTSFYEAILRDLPDFKCRHTDLKGLQKYTRIHNSLLDGMVENMGENEVMFTNEALIMLESVSETSNLVDASDLLTPMKASVDFDIEKFYKHGSDNNNDVKQSQSFFDNLKVAEKDNTQTAPIVVEKLKVETEINNDKVLVVNEIDSPINLNEQYQSSVPTINDQHKSVETKNIADLHQNTPIKNLSASISLNQKFVFINKLFNGDSAAYAETLEILEKCGSQDEAINLLKYKYAPKYSWNLNSDEADELMDTIKRKF